MNKRKQTILFWLYNFLHVQFFLSVVSLPILVAWGLPFSVMTVVGNLIFTPFLFLFLFISTALFFSEILHIPNATLSWLLEKLHAFWLFLLSKGSTQWLYAIDSWGLVVCCAATVMACIVLHHKQWGREKNSWKFFIPLLLAPFSYQQLRGFFSYEGTITCIRKTASIASKKGKISLLDYGALGEKKSAGTWIQYNFLSDVIKQCGSIRFDTVTCPYATARTIEALETLTHHAPIKKIILTHPIRQSKRYKELCKQLATTAKREGIVLVIERMPR